MRTPKFVVEGVALAAAASMLAGCDPHDNELPTPSLTFEALESSPGVTPEQTDTYAPPSMAETLGHSAALNLIVVDVTNRAITSRDKDERDLPTPLNAMKFLGKVVAEDPSYLRQFDTAFRRATYGRYDPETVNVTKGEPIRLPHGCIDANNAADVNLVNNAGAAAAKEDALNVVLLNARSCNRDVAGYANSSILPVVIRDGFYSYTAADDVVHETGHKFGLQHAGVVKCKGINETICFARSTADPNSVMSYKRPRTHWVPIDTYRSVGISSTVGRFSAPELYKLGYMKKAEVVVNPAFGKISIGDIASKGLKLIVDTHGKDPTYISWATDDNAPYDKECVYGNKLPKKISVMNQLETGRDGKNKPFVCYKVNRSAATHSLQVRRNSFVSDQFSPEEKVTDSLVLIDAQPKVKNVIEGPPWGESFVKPRAVIWKNGAVAYTLEKNPASGRATVRVS